MTARIGKFPETLAISRVFYSQEAEKSNDMPAAIADTDAAILRLVQEDARLTIEMIAQSVGLSPSAAQRRLQRLRDEKVILRGVAILDPKKVGSQVTVLVELELERDRPELLPALHQWLAKTPQVQQAWYVTGRGDYTLVIVSPSIEEFDALIERLVAENRNIRKFTTSVVLKTLKRSLGVPVG
jgi:Lrp/AsnC family leucine-responsive transcriptional regulator